MIQNHKYDRSLTGIIAGLIIPMVFLVLIILNKKAENDFWEYFGVAVQLRIMPKLISLCLIPNLLLFFGFLKFNWLNSARGVIISMFIAAAFILIFKFI